MLISGIDQFIYLINSYFSAYLAHLSSFRHQLAVRGNVSVCGGTLQPPERVGAEPVLLRQEPSLEDYGHASLLS